MWNTETGSDSSWDRMRPGWPLTVDDGVFDRVIGFYLIRPQSRVIVCELLKAFVGRFDIGLNQLGEGRRREEFGYLSRKF